MVADQALSTTPHRARPVRSRRWRVLLVLSSLIAVIGYLGWVAVLVWTLPSRYLASHWDIAWAGFDVMLLASLLTTGWALVRRPPWARTALTITATMLLCDAWFDVTTASGPSDTVLSIVLAAGGLTTAAALAWVAVRLPAGRHAGGADITASAHPLTPAAEGEPAP